MTDVQQRAAAKEFAAKWEGRGRERAESQPFWLSLLRDVYGVEHPEDMISFESSVMLDHASFIDGHIPKTHVLIEQKSRGKDLDAPIKQSDGTLLNPFQQAKRYSAELPYDDRPRWIVTSNFEEFRIYDMNRPNDPAEVLKLAHLENEAHRLNFLVDKGSLHVRREMEISVEAGQIVGTIYDALKQQYIDPDSEASQHSLNVLCVRLVFCLYAENAGIFGAYGVFGDYLTKHKNDARNALLRLFAVLDEREEDRDPYLDDDLASFPYVNGGLFRTSVEIPKITPEIVDLILHKASEGFNWRDISPTIFGAIFESTLNPETRRSGGMHYTSVENIHKVIDPLFLDELREELETAQSWKQEKKRRSELQAFRDKLSRLRFLDPACGSGNFLTETYLSLRRLENEAIRSITHGQIGWAMANPVQVSIEQFSGIEINDFAVTVAQTALWIAEAQMLQETEQILSMSIEYLPLTTVAHIEEGNALRMDWNDVLPASECSYVMGNPPFLGYAYQSPSQKADLALVYGKGAKTVDYVSGWFLKATEYMIRRPAIRTAFVSTNSIAQGEQITAVWERLIHSGAHIDFAWKSFVWNSEASLKAHVHVVIIGFSVDGTQREKWLFTETGKSRATNISPYLTDNPTVFIHRRTEPLCEVAPICMRGSQPTDNGNLILTQSERDELLISEPQAAPLIRPFLMGADFIKRRPRWCLWMVGTDPKLIRNCPLVKGRIEKVRKFREASKKAATRRKAETPMLFDEIRDSKTRYIAVPKVSSERRRYIPMDYLEAEVIPGDMLFEIPDAELYHFGVLTSNVHMAWMRTVAGRLKSDYRYNNTVVYNNFPWPEPTSEQKAKIEKTAQAILDARALYPDSSLADLYDEATMPPELRKAHQENDKAVMVAYGFRKGNHWLTEAEAVIALIEMYAELVAKEEHR